MLYVMCLVMVNIPKIPQGDKYYHVNDYILEVAGKKMVDTDIFIIINVMRDLYVQYKYCHYNGKYAVYQGAYPVRQRLILRYVHSLSPEFPVAHPALLRLRYLTV